MCKDKFQKHLRTIELLAPAKDLACGKAAILHGADAVYIGASRFGARQSAGNSVEDIASLCEFAHKYGATVHVTLNTIIYDDELTETISLVKELIGVGVDAFLLQDMGLLSSIRTFVPNHIALHASTQCDTRTAEKAAWLSEQGFDRVVLARELSVKEISEIHHQLPNLELEVFVHGALCVSYSGVCYASQFCSGRSANRGACSQFCRLAFDLKDSNGKVIEHARHLLSLKDMSQINNLEALMRSGACAFKIEGRLKDINYVKNVVSSYNQAINKIIQKYPNEFRRASLGNVHYNFTPDLHKTFNRGYTSYFLNGRQPDIFSPNTPKALGEYVGKVKEIRRDSFNVSSMSSFANGDGLCFLHTPPTSKNGEAVLEGFRINRAVGNRLYPFKMPKGLKPGTSLYRNQDQAFDKILSGDTAERKISISMQIDVAPDGFEIKVGIPSTNIHQSSFFCFAHQEAKKNQHDNIVNQLTKLGNTVYECINITVGEGVDKLFIPNSVLTEMRRTVLQSLDEQILSIPRISIQRTNEETRQVKQPSFTAVNPSEYAKFPYLYNISNAAAREFYKVQGLQSSTPAMEISRPNSVQTKDHLRAKNEADALLMQCRHCIRYSLGYCVKHGGKQPTWHEPLFLELPDKRRFRLEFNCKACQMNIHPV